MASSISYALRVLAGRLISFRDRACPYCQGTQTQAVGKKHVILQLRVCRECGLKYRFPKDDPSHTETFYQDCYFEPTVTTLPSPEQIEDLIASAFKGSGFDKSDKIDFIISRVGEVGKGMSILDYGASFGYLMSQLKSRGLDRLVGYEISRHRARFGMENLGVEILCDPNNILSHPLYPYDVIISSHVLEHLSCISDAFDFFHNAIRRPGGHLFIWVPNASKTALDRFHNGSWAPLVGETHTVAFDYDFFRKSLPRHGFSILETGDPSAAELTLVAEAN